MRKTGFCSIFLGLILVFLSVPALAQNASDNSPMQTLLQSKRYTFTAQYAQPMSGRQVNLTTLYTLTIAGDSLICDLPYYGVAYVAPADPSKNDFRFISNHFDYKVSPSKHSRYIISIQIKDRTAVQQMYLNVSKKGYATLQVTPTNKQAISYYGKVDANKR